tara:strand:+ start:1376 stop:2473 length:1098 start_codon:yes stop_codon:yes gene_type:complete
MVKSKYKTAIVGFYQITDSYNGASEVTKSLFECIKSKKKLFELKNPSLFKHESKFSNIINSYLIKPFKILSLCLKVKKYFANNKKNFLIVEGASWIGFSFLFIIISKFLNPNVKVMYHGHNVEYEIRKMKNSKIIQVITKYLEKKVFSICDYATTVSNHDRGVIRKLYNINSIVFFNGISKKRLNISKKKIYEKNYLIFSGNYFFQPNKIAIKNILKILPKIHKLNAKIKILITGTNLPHKIRSHPHIIFKPKLKKEVLNLYLKKSICSVMPLIDSPGTKLKVIENLLIGVVTIGTKHAFKGIELWKKNPPFVYKTEQEIIKFLKIVLKNKNKLKKIAKKNSQFYVRKYLMENVYNNFIKNEFKF